MFKNLPLSTETILLAAAGVVLLAWPRLQVLIASLSRRQFFGEVKATEFGSDEQPPESLRLFVGQLLDACPDAGAEFVVDQLSGGSTLSQAKSAYIASLKSSRSAKGSK